MLGHFCGRGTFTVLSALIHHYGVILVVACGMALPDVGVL